jgi:hypothetical protein
MQTTSPRAGLAAGCLISLLIATAGHSEVAPADHAAIFKAAGFTKAPDDKYIRCKEEIPTLSYTPGHIELADLNGDGRPEAWVTEGSLYCYGNTARYFVLVTKDGDTWQRLLEDVGIPLVQDTRHHGWPDIEVGGPGFSKLPVYRWDGKSYQLHR